MSWMSKIERYMKDMGLKSYERLEDGFIVSYPGERHVVKIHIIVDEPFIGFRSFFMSRPENDPDRLYRKLLELNGHSFMIKWYIDDDGDVYIATERLLRDMQFSEFETAMISIVKGFDKHHEECLALSK